MLFGLSSLLLFDESAVVLLQLGAHGVVHVLLPLGVALVAVVSTLCLPLDDAEASRGTDGGLKVACLDLVTLQLLVCNRLGLPSYEAKGILLGSDGVPYQQRSAAVARKLLILISFGKKWTNK